MKKRVLSLVVSLLATSLFAASETINGITWNYNVSGGKATIISCPESASGAVTIIDIPATINGYPVTTIGDYAFSGHSSLTSVTIPKGMTSFGGWAFYNCTSLTAITIPEGVTFIGDSAFALCYSLTSVTIPKGVTSIGWNAFGHCYGLTSVTI